MNSGASHGYTSNSGGYQASWSTDYRGTTASTPAYAMSQSAFSGGSTYNKQNSSWLQNNQNTGYNTGMMRPNQSRNEYLYSPSTNYALPGTGNTQWRSSIFSDSSYQPSRNLQSIWASPMSNPRPFLPKRQSQAKPVQTTKSTQGKSVQKSTPAAIEKPKQHQKSPKAATVADKSKPAETKTFPSKSKGGVPKKTSPKKGAPNKEGNKKMNYGGGYGRGYFVPRGGKNNYRRKRDNKQDDIPFNAVPEGEPFIAFPVSFENMLCFHGFSSIFTTQHMFPVLIDGKIYESCDHFYQIEKTRQLCGQSSEKMTATVRDEEGKRLDGKVGFRSHEEKGYSALAKEMLRLAGVSKDKIEEWRHTKGLEVVQKALLAKLTQCPELRDALRNSGDKILVHCYPGDAIYGSGTRINGIKSWCDEMKKNEAKLIVPISFPLTEETVKYCPVVGKGRNVLGVIMMQLRNLVLTEQVALVDMSLVFDGLVQANPAITSTANHANDNLDDDDTMNGFTIGGGPIQCSLGSPDFTHGLVKSKKNALHSTMSLVDRGHSLLGTSWHVACFQ
ncbi:unnamed protein product, partial [Mesorhabditis belari]|uniref:NADAR domain-containing protein n=1 Tax=Mesorhabditis belari TaxID=2138241 RepID=A0AAF3F4E1_9BILA